MKRYNYIKGGGEMMIYLKSQEMLTFNWSLGFTLHNYVVNAHYMQITGIKA